MKPTSCKKYNTSKMVICKCPKCEKLHKLKIDWISDTIPRKYCKSCIVIIRQINTIYVDLNLSDIIKCEPIK